MKRVVIGVGNPYRGDDAAGTEVARRLRATGMVGATVLEHDGEPAGLLDAWEGAEAAYVVDAVRGDTPGRVHRLEIGPSDNAGVPTAQTRDSSHALGLGDAVELGRALGRLPRRLIVVGVEGVHFEADAGLSDEVDEATTRVAAELARELSREVERGCA